MIKLPHLILSAMTPFPYTVERKQSVESARELMRAHTIRHLPVTEDGHPVGIVSDRDIQLACAILGNAANDDDDTLIVEQVCVLEPYVVQTTAPIFTVVSHMAEQHIDAAVVVKDDKVVGIFTATDACKTLAALLDDDSGPDLVA